MPHVRVCPPAAAGPGGRPSRHHHRHLHQRQGQAVAIAMATVHKLLYADLVTAELT